MAKNIRVKRHMTTVMKRIGGRLRRVRVPRKAHVRTVAGKAKDVAPYVAASAAVGLVKIEILNMRIKRLVNKKTKLRVKKVSTWRGWKAEYRRLKRPSEWYTIRFKGTTHDGKNFEGKVKVQVLTGQLRSSTLKVKVV